MIITNLMARIVVGIAGMMTPGTLGVTIWPFIFIYPIQYKDNKRLVRHERKHIEQYLRYWIIGFFPLYIYQFLKYGYWDMPLEIEARKAETRSE